MIKYTIKDKVNYKELRNIMEKTDANTDWKTNVFASQYRNKKQELETIKRSLYFTARKNKKLIGLIRIVTAGYFYFIMEVAVLSNYRKLGIGKRLLLSTLKYCKQQGYIKIMLIANPDVEKFYSKFGFKNSKCQSMELIYHE